jgi:mono/diheme cytochrome c family protein
MLAMRTTFGSFFGAAPAVLFGDVPGTVLDGVILAAQAMRGEAQYQMHCSRCHGEDLSGRAMGPLKGDKFGPLARG